jgi:hypothetical protein
MGGRYQQMLPSGDLQDLPTTARAACHASRAQFVQADRGHIQRNDASADSCLRLFASWLESKRFTRESAAKLRSKQMINLLGAFLTDVKNGNNFSNSKITGQTLQNYVKSATDCFSLLTGFPLQIYDIATLSQKKACLHPYLQELISQGSNWTQPKPRKESYTYRMLANQASFIARSALHCTMRWGLGGGFSSPYVRGVRRICGTLVLFLAQLPSLCIFVSFQPRCASSTQTVRVRFIFRLRMTMSLLFA